MHYALAKHRGDDCEVITVHPHAKQVVFYAEETHSSVAWTVGAPGENISHAESVVQWAALDDGILAVHKVQ
jgi:hypothetical protein